MLYLDKGFAATAIITYLTTQQQPAIIANPIRGKEGGTRALCRGRSSYTTTYTFTDGTQATMAMKASLVPDKTGQRRRKWLAFIVILLDWSAEKVIKITVGDLGSNVAIACFAVCVPQPLLVILLCASSC